MHEPTTPPLPADRSAIATPFAVATPASPVPPGDALDGLACVYVCAGVVRDLATGFGHAPQRSCYCLTMANGAAPVPCSER